MTKRDDCGQENGSEPATTTFEVGRFQTVGCAAAQSILDRLLDDVASGCGRVKITGSDPATTCVLISQNELSSLEHALEILSGTAGADVMRSQIAKLVAAAGTTAHSLNHPSFRRPAGTEIDRPS